MNDGITPQSDYTLELQNDDRTIKLTVKSGLQKPYLYKSKAYKRNGTATIEVDALELQMYFIDWGLSKYSARELYELSSSMKRE